MTTTTTALPPPVQQKFDMKLLARPMQKNIHSFFAMKKVMEEHVGDILRMRRYTNLAQFPVPLGPNFLNPPTQVLSATDIDAQVQYYATSVLITKQVTLINEDPRQKLEAAK
jgi:N4-gp56 family major capsid protein